MASPYGVSNCADIAGPFIKPGVPDPATGMSVPSGVILRIWLVTVLRNVEIPGAIDRQSARRKALTEPW